MHFIQNLVPIPRLSKVVVLSFYLLHSVLHAQTAPKGINFTNGDFQKAMSLAQSANKPLFVEVYLNGCPHCEALAPILNEKQVGDFYNTHFISWKVEANSKESATLQKAKGITYPEFPLLLFFDTKGTLIHLATPAEPPTKAAFVEEVVKQGQLALDPRQRTESYAARFQAGERDILFLISYGKYCKVLKDAQHLNEVNNALSKQLVDPKDITSQTGFYVLQRIVNSFESPLAGYFFQHLDEFRAKYPAKDVKEAGEAILYNTLYGPKGDTYSAQAIEKMRQAMVKLGVSSTDAAARTLLKELDAHFRAGTAAPAVARFNGYRKLNKAITTEDYAYIMRYFNEKAPDNTYLPELPLWGNDALQLVKPATQPKTIAEVHYELAQAYLKMGKKDLARQSAQKALASAKTAHVDTRKYEEQIGKLK